MAVLDNFSKYVRLCPIRRTNASDVVKCLTSYISDVGTPKSILFDNSIYFHANNVASFIRRHHIELIFTPIRHYQANASERQTRTILQILRIYEHWTLHLDEIEAATLTTKISPISYYTSKLSVRSWNLHPPDIDPEELIRNTREHLQQNQTLCKSKRNKRNKIKCRVGHKVVLGALRIGKRVKGIERNLVCPYEGPYCIAEELSSKTHTRVT
ncbi:hypothetical protein Trydic_g23923 [Trypoxylus dichotomus]